MESSLREIQQRVSELLEMIEQEKQYVTPQASGMATEDVLRRSIGQLMDATYIDSHGKSRMVVTHAVHWQAIYRILVDYNLGATDGDYLGFAEWVPTIEPTDCRVKFKYHSLRSISRTPFVRPFVKWHYDSTYFQTRLPYENMVRVAEAFLLLLKENGLVKS